MAAPAGMIKGTRLCYCLCLVNRHNLLGITGSLIPSIWLVVEITASSFSMAMKVFIQIICCYVFSPVLMSTDLWWQLGYDVVLLFALRLCTLCFGWISWVIPLSTNCFLLATLRINPGLCLVEDAWDQTRVASLSIGPLGLVRLPIRLWIFHPFPILHWHVLHFRQLSPLVVS